MHLGGSQVSSECGGLYQVLKCWGNIGGAGGKGGESEINDGLQSVSVYIFGPLSLS